MDQSKMGVSHYSQMNAGSRLYGLTSQQPRSITAGGGDDNDWKTGATIDRTDPALFLSAQNVISVLPTLNTGETATVSRRYRHTDTPDDAGSWVELDVLPDDDDSLDAVVITAAQMAATAGPRTYRDNVDLSGAKQYVRCDVKVDLSRATTDTCTMAAVMALAGVDNAPV
jgi:hypothetical protein